MNATRKDKDEKMDYTKYYDWARRITENNPLTKKLFGNHNTLLGMPLCEITQKLYEKAQGGRNKYLKKGRDEIGKFFSWYS